MIGLCVFQIAHANETVPVLDGNIGRDNDGVEPRDVWRLVWRARLTLARRSRKDTFMQVHALDTHHGHVFMRALGETSPQCCVACPVAIHHNGRRSQTHAFSAQKTTCTLADCHRQRPRHLLVESPRPSILSRPSCGTSTAPKILGGYPAPYWPVRLWSAPCGHSGESSLLAFESQQKQYSHEA